jgi:ATP-dependent DNA helicase RecG
MRRVEGYLNRLTEAAGRPSRASDTLEHLTLLGCVAQHTNKQSGEQILRPTNAGLLLFGYSPRFFFPQAEIICTYYRDTSGIRRYDDRRIITGTITDQIDQAFAFLKLYTPVGAHVEGVSRVDEPLLPLESLREAIVNAVVHRDYSLEGEAIRIFYYSNRVEIHNPGLLVPGLSLDELQQGRSRSKPRNLIIASILRDMPGNYMERVGTGIPFIINQMRSLHLPAPEFNQSGEFVVTFWYNPDMPTTSGRTPQLEQPPIMPEEVSSEVNDFRERRFRLALEQVRQRGVITNREYQQLTGVSESTASRDLDLLVEQGSLKRTGKGPARRYLLP